MIKEGKCPGCDRHCDLSDPHCGKGEAIARGENPEMMDYHGGKDLRRNRNQIRRKLMEDRYARMETEEKLVFQLARLGHVARRIPEQSSGQSGILHILKEKGEITQRDLTELLDIRPGSASELIGKLEAAGLVARTENPDDRRTVNIRLTEAGKARLEEARLEQEKDSRPELFAVLTGEEREQLLLLLEKLTKDWSERFHEKPGRGRRPGEHRGPGGHHGPDSHHGPDGHQD